MHTTAQRKYHRLIKQLNELGHVCNGSIKEMYRTCGKPGCRCAEDPEARHGPYFIWTGHHKGKPICRSLSKQQAADFRRCNRNYRKMKKLIEGLCEIVAEAISKQTY